ncbi:MAG: phytoene/squalene synthase family protein [Pseudomonadota bacterium]
MLTHSSFRQAVPDDFDHCRTIIKAGSKSFYAASLLLPKGVRTAAYATYAFCREADDAIDLGTDPKEAISTLTHRLNLIYAGRPLDDPVDRAFSDVVANWGMPRTLPDALLEGLIWDSEGRRYETFDDLIAYCTRVAGAVGAMMTTLMGATCETAAARATDLGVAMQLTNIARDIGEDARAGRIYAPLEWLREAGIDPAEFVAKPEFDEKIEVVTKRLLDAAEPLYERGLTGAALLPSGCRTAIISAGLIYKDIGRYIQQNDYDSVTYRAFVPKRRKLELVALASAYPAQIAALDPPLPQNDYLVKAIVSQSLQGAEPKMPSRAVWLLDLFLRVEQRKRAGHPHSGDY